YLVGANAATVSGNRILNNADEGITGGTDADLTVTGNTLRGNRGMALTVAGSSTISDNTVEDSGPIGLGATGGSVTFTGNHVSNSGSALLVSVTQATVTIT